MNLSRQLFIYTILLFNLIFYFTTEAQHPKETHSRWIKLLLDSSNLTSEVNLHSVNTATNSTQENNIKSPFWIPIAYSMGANVFIWSVDRFVFNKEYSKINASIWKRNIKVGWKWDNDRFAPNFLGHPYSGSLMFNSARSNGYTFTQSIPFTIAGNLVWEYLGENQYPSTNDIITSSINGPLFGEILYRISSNILDDGAIGRERVMREIAAGIVNPMRELNRVIQGKTKKVIHYKPYKKEPLLTNFYTGIKRLNSNNESLTHHAVLNLTLDYGNPFEIRYRKPFDIFYLETNISMGAGRRFFDNINAYGILWGKNFKIVDVEILSGAFQHFEYYYNHLFEFSTFAFSGGMISRLPFAKNISLFNNLHFGVMPLTSTNSYFVPDDLEYRDYYYGDGIETQFVTRLSFGELADICFKGNFYWINTFHEGSETNFIRILKQSCTYRLIDNFYIGFENSYYVNKQNSSDFSKTISKSHEVRLYLLLKTY